MKQTNFHTHTSRCHHAFGNDEEFVRTAIQNGFEVLGFSDHACWKYDSDFVAHMRMKLDEFDDYKDSVLYLKDRYKKQIEIRFGLEAEYFPKYMDWLLDFCIENEIDYLIFGNHYYGTDEDNFYLGGAKGKYIKGYFDTCVEGMKTGMYAYLAHPELILRSTGGVITPEIEEGFHRICKTSQDYNVPLEFNVLGMQHNLRMGYEEYPHSRFWQIAGQYDVKAIIGMDAHEVGDLNKKWYDFALEKLSEFDVEIIDDVPSIDYKKIKAEKIKVWQE